MTETEKDEATGKDDQSVVVKVKEQEILTTNNMVDEEKRIFRIIKKITQQRNRACFQNILNFACRENKNMNMEMCKNVVNELLQKKLIVDKSKSNTESFKVVGSMEEIKNPLLMVNGEVANILESTEETDDVNYEVLDDKFYNFISNMIKEECKIAVQDCIKKDSIKHDPIKHDLIDDSSIIKNAIENIHLKDLIAEQKKQIEFLRNDLLSKDKVIQMLLSVTSKDVNDTHSTLNKLNKPTLNINNEQVDDDKLISDTSNEEKRNKNRSVVILGDSLLKDIETQKVRKSLNNNEKVYVKSFSGATTTHMKSYVIPSKEFENDLIILHCGTNDLRSTKSPTEIATEIYNLALDLKTTKNDVMISGIVPRRDKLNDKGMEVNKCVFSFCSEHNIHFIDNSNINIKTHINTSGLHLNYTGTYALGKNLVNAINV